MQVIEKVPYEKPVLEECGSMVERTLKHDGSGDGSGCGSGSGPNCEGS